MFYDVGPGAPADQQRDLTVEEYSEAVWRVAKEVLQTPEGDHPPELMSERMPEGWGLKDQPKRKWMEDNCADVLPSKYCRVDPDLRRQVAEIRAHAQASRSTTVSGAPTTRPSAAPTPGSAARSRASSAEELGILIPPPPRPASAPADA